MENLFAVERETPVTIGVLYAVHGAKSYVATYLVHHNSRLVLDDHPKVIQLRCIRTPRHHIGYLKVNAISHASRLRDHLTIARHDYLRARYTSATFHHNGHVETALAVGHSL